MLLTALKKKSFLTIIVLFGLLALITLAFSVLPPTKSQTVTAAKTVPLAYTPSLNNTSNLQSDSFSYAEKGDLKKLLLTRDILRETASYLTCQLKGIEPINPLTDCIIALSSNTTDKQELFKTGGMMAFTSSAIGSISTPPISGLAYSKKSLGEFGIQKEANAQQKGTGFNSLNQIQEIWILFRNIAYLLLIIVFVIVGILIMLRVNIDPRTVMSIQNQIPKAIVAIVLITFSYAIGGLLVDGMWVATYFGVNTMTSTQPPCEKDGKQITLTSVVTKSLLDNPIAFTTDILGDETGCSGSWDGIQGLTLKVAQTFGDIFTRVGMTIFGADETIGDCNIGVKKAFGILPVGIEAESSFTNCIKLALFSIFKYLIMIIAYLVVLLAILAALFRVWFTLLKAYLFLIIEILLAPFYILLGLIPGSNLSFKGWVKGIIAQLAVFPTIVLVLVLASIVSKSSSINNPTDAVFLPPLIGNPNIADNLGALMAFGLILLVPDLSNIVREALKAPASKQTGGITALTGFAAGRVIGAGKGAEERLSHRGEQILTRPGQTKKLFNIPFTHRGIG